MACIKLRNPSSLKSTKDDLGLPRSWVTVWADVVKASMGFTTQGHHLYAATDRQSGVGAPDRMLSELDMDVAPWAAAWRDCHPAGGRN